MKGGIYYFVKLKILLLLLPFLVLPSFVYANDDVILNVNDKHNNSSISNNGLTFTSNSNPGGARANIGRNSGKYYFEVTRIAGSQAATIIGFSTRDFRFSSATFDHLYGYYNANGYKYPERVPYGEPWEENGTIIGVAMDFDSGSLEFFLNGESQGISHADINVDELLYPTVYTGTSLTSVVTFNFGATDFNYSIPEGYLSYDGSQSYVEPPEEPEPPDHPDYNDLEVTNLSYVVDVSTVTLNYQYDSSLLHVNIYRDGIKIADSYKESNYTDYDLRDGETYVYRITTVDQYGNESQGRTIAVTISVIPNPPKNVSVAPMDKALRVHWNRNSESNVIGYNVYMDNEKVNDQLIPVNTYVISDLQNGESYAISVTAVNRNGNESEQSLISIGTPSEKSMAIVKLPFTLTDLGQSIANWFDGLWPFIAFCVSIPIAFYIGHKVKELIVT